MTTLLFKAAFYTWIFGGAILMAATICVLIYEALASIYRMLFK